MGTARDCRITAAKPSTLADFSLNKVKQYVAEKGMIKNEVETFTDLLSV